MKNKINYFTVFISSALILAYELLFIRIFSIREWQSYTSLVISLALLGFGISGTIITFLKDVFKKNIIYYSMIFLIIHLVISAASFTLYCIIPFNPFEIGWNNIQILYFILKFTAVLLPFITGSIIIGIQFISGEKPDVIYFFNLTGSSFGMVITLVFLNFFKPYDVLLIFLFSYAAFIIMIFFYIYRTPRIIFIIVVPAFFNFFISNLNLLKVSEYKAMQYALKMPRAKILFQKNSPACTVDVVEAPGLREIKGLSYNFTGELPLQKCIYFDADSPSPVTPFDNDLNKISFTSFTTQALPYHLIKGKTGLRVMIAGTGGGEGILRALYFGSREITGLETSRNVIELMKNELSAYSGNIYNRGNVGIYNLDARDFARITKKTFDIIEISLIDSVISTGFNSINENYLFTVESFHDFYNRLSDRGIMAVTRWIREPPYDPVKLFNTFVESAVKYGINDYRDKIAFIRSSNTATVCISKKKIDTGELKKFADKMSFDTVYFSGIEKSDADRFFRIRDSDLFETCHNIINRDKSYLKNYLFNISAPSDSRPYFHDFIKFKTLPVIFKKGPGYLSFNELGFFLLLTVLIPVILISFILIIFPLFFSKKLKIKSLSLNFKIPSLLYFFLIGISYMSVEIILIQKFVLFLLHPVYSVSIVIISMLFFSGTGSMVSGKIKNKKMIFIFLTIAALLLIYLLFLNRLFYFFLTKNFIIRTALSVILTGIPAFFMGMPFPSMLSFIKKKNEIMVPWLWVVNGFASVISSLLSALLNILIGFNYVMLIAVVLYIAAGGIYKMIICANQS